MKLKTITFALALLTGVSACATRQSTETISLPLQETQGSQWFKLPTVAFQGKQDDVFFVNTDLGFYANGQGKIYRTTDGGITWNLVLDKPGTYFRALGMVDAKHGYAGNIGIEYFPGVTDETPLYETNDGGSTWQAVQGLPGKPMKGICAIDILKTQFINAGVLDQRTVIHAGGRVGSPAQLLRSLDGGKSWTQIDMSPWVSMIVDVKFFDEMNGVVFAGSDPQVANSHAQIVATHDGGKTWNKVYESKRQYELTWKGSFPSRDVGYATIQNYNPDKAEDQRYIVKTVDGGKTWIEMPLVKDFAVREFGVGFANVNLGWVGTTKGGFETRDGGLTWKPVNLGRYVNKIRILPDDKGSFNAYAIGADVFKFGIAPAALPSTKPAPDVAVGKP
ncbi:WD40/YVTN/BNR-like repeat-containing protein [Undibacterium sp. Di24W]|uniref:WD40/YVTN/BNR-like repeat-containing protein n=1 Tax=Undibacterium sp. Di24W TaxID=3413033 RepID=UPI003BF36243